MLHYVMMLHDEAELTCRDQSQARPGALIAPAPYGWMPPSLPWQAMVVVALVDTFVRQFRTELAGPGSIGIIAPYRAQVAAIQVLGPWSS